MTFHFDQERFTKLRSTLELTLQSIAAALHAPAGLEDGGLPDHLVAGRPGVSRAILPGHGRPVRWTVAVAVSLLAGCDPIAPGATGTVDVAANVDPTSYDQILMLIYENPSGELDLPELAEIRSTAMSTWWNGDLAEIAFPYDYETTGGVGTSQYSDWRLVAWLTSGEELPDPIAPVAGDAYGTATFEVPSCGHFFGGYCGVVDGVDIVITDVLAR